MLKTLQPAWNRLWFPRGSPVALAAFRILFAVVLLWELETTRMKSVFAIVGGFHLPYVSFIQPVSEALYNAMHDWQYPLIALLGLGILTRPAIALLIVLQGYIFFADHLNFRNHPYFFLIVLLLLLLSPCDQALSLRSWLERIKRRKARTTTLQLPMLTAQQMIKFQISVVYFYAALHKMSNAYLSGSVMADLMSKTVLQGYSGMLFRSVFSAETVAWIDAFSKEPSSWVIVSWATVILELLLPFALWFRRSRLPAMMFGIPFHLGIAWLMGIHTFSLAMIGSYLLFLDPDTAPQLMDRILRQSRTPEPDNRGKPKPSVRRRMGKT